MNPEKRQVSKVLFERLVELPASERAAYLDRNCDDPEIRVEVERLLARSTDPSSRLTFDPGETASSPDAPGPPADPDDVPRGTVVADRYRVVERLGRGGMGAVYLAEDSQLERQVALKFLAPELARNEEQRRRFLKEARSASALNHPNVCVVYEVGEVDDRPFIAMEFIEGDDLSKRIRRGSLGVDEILDIAMQIADALDAAHSKGIVHRDIKPANISVDDRGRVKVLDFGLAKRVDGSLDVDGTRPGTILGTLAYMSPEQALGQTVDPRSDIFSTGTVLYEMVTERLPFRGDTFAEVVDNIVHAQPEAMARFNYDVPPELERIARKCLEKNPEERYQTARDLLVDLKSLRREVDVDSSAPGAARRTAVNETVPAQAEMAVPDADVLRASAILPLLSISPRSLAT